jgi:NAD-dependent deacetylase
MSGLQFTPTLLDRLRDGAPLGVLTGAGVSAESGLATFRGPRGLWEGRDPFELATPGAFDADPETVWSFYAWRRQQAARAQPNAAHHALARLETIFDDFLLATQNVDGLHERAGNRRMVRLHGTLWRLRCVADGNEVDDLREDLGPGLPRCGCGAPLRPAVVWFGEALPGDSLAAAEHAMRRARLVLVVGTSSLVHPAALLPRIEREAGAWVVEINPEPTPLTAEADEWLAGPAGVVLPALLDAAGIAMERGA